MKSNFEKFFIFYTFCTQYIFYTIFPNQEQVFTKILQKSSVFRIRDSIFSCSPFFSSFLLFVFVPDSWLHVRCFTTTPTAVSVCHFYQRTSEFWHVDFGGRRLLSQMSCVIGLRWKQLQVIVRFWAMLPTVKNTFAGKVPLPRQNNYSRGSHVHYALDHHINCRYPFHALSYLRRLQAAQHQSSPKSSSRHLFFTE